METVDGPSGPYDVSKRVDLGKTSQQGGSTDTSESSPVSDPHNAATSEAQQSVLLGQQSQSEWVAFGHSAKTYNVISYSDTKPPPEAPPTGHVFLRNQEGKITHAVETPKGEDLSSGVYIPTPGEPSKQGVWHVFIVDNERTPIGVVNPSEMPDWVVPGYTVGENGQACITHAVEDPVNGNPMGSGLPDDMVWVEGDKGPIGAVRVPEGDPYAGVMINGEQHVFIVDNERTPIGVVNLSEMPNWVVPGYTVHENRQAHITHAVAKPEFDDSGGPGLPDDMVWVEGDKGPIGAVRVPEGDPYAGVMINGEQHVFIVNSQEHPIGVVNPSKMPEGVVPGYTVKDGNADVTHAVETPGTEDSVNSMGPGLPDGMVWVEGDKGPIGAVRVPEGDPYAGVMINGEQHVFIVDNQGTHIGLVNPSKMPDGVVPGYTFKDGNAQITHAVATPGLDEFGKPIDAEPPDDMVWVQGDNGPIGAVQVPKDAGSSFSVSIEGKTYYFQYENGGWCETSYEDAMSVLSGANSSGVFVNMGGADAPSGTPAQPTSNEVAQNSETVSEAQLTTDQVTATEAATAVAYGGIALSVVGRAVTQAGKIRQLADVLYSIGISDHNQSQANDSNGSNHEKLTQGGIEKLMAGVRSQQETAATKAGLAAIGAVGAGATAAVGGFASAAGIIGTARDVKNKAERFNNMATLRAKVTEKLEALNAKPTNVEQTTSPATQSGGATREPSDPLANSDNQQKLTELTFKVTGLLDEKGFRRTAGGIAGGLNTVLHAVTIASIPLGGFAPINILNKGVDAVKTFANNVQAERYLKENGSTISSSEVKKSNWEALKSLGNKWRKKEIKNNNDNEPEYKQAGRLVAKPVQLLGRLAVGLYKATTDTIVDAALAIPSAIEVLGRNRTDTVARLRGKSTEEFKDPIFCNNIKKGLKKGFDFGGGVSWLSDKWFGTFDQTKVRAFKEADIQQAFLDAYDGATEDQKKAIVRPLHN